MSLCMKEYSTNEISTDTFQKTHIKYVPQNTNI